MSNIKKQINSKEVLVHEDCISLIKTKFYYNMKDNKNLILSCLYNETILQTSGTTGMTELTFVPSIDRAGVEAW